MNEIQHLTLPFHFKSDEKKIDLSTFQFQSSKQKPVDFQVMNSEKGKFVLKRILENNIIFKVKKFQNKQNPEIFFYQLEYDSELNESYDPQYYFQDFYFQTENNQTILEQFKQYIQKGTYELEKQNVPRDISKPFSWRGSNFKFNLMKKKSKQNKLEKKQYIHSLKFGDESPQNNYETDIDPLIKQFFNKKPIWMKESLKQELKNIPQFEEKIGQIAFYYYNGPWAKCYIDKQYYPKLNPIAAKYQTITIKNPLTDEQNSDDVDIPQKTYTVCQLCDVQDEEVQRIIKETIQKVEKSNQQIIISEKYGWFDKMKMKIIIRKIKSMRQHQN